MSCTAGLEKVRQRRGEIAALLARQEVPVDAIRIGARCETPLLSSSYAEDSRRWATKSN